MPAATSNSVMGMDCPGRWTAVGARGLAGDTSRNDALRYAGLETARKSGPGRIGHHGEGLPAWWRLAPSTRGSRSYWDNWPIATREEKRWLMIDFGIVAGLIVLCLAVGSIVS
jgi:hypothetical protein